MSGRYAHATGAIGLSHFGWPLPLEVRTTVDDFRDAGYETILSGLNHERHPKTDRYETDLAKDWDDWRAPRAVDAALGHLRRREGGRPFYLNVATQEPHACTWSRVGEDIPVLPDAHETWLPDGMPRTPALEAAFRRFVASVAFTDHHFGRLVEGLGELGLLDETVVVFTTDHGVAGPRGKGTLHGLGTEIALLVRLPGGTGGGGERHQLVANIDFRATWCEGFGLDGVEAGDGRSFWPLLSDADRAHHELIYLERNFHGERPWRTEDDYVDCYDPVRALRTKDALYVRNFLPEAKPPEPLPRSIESVGTADWSCWEKSWQLPASARPAEELYLLNEDPQELRNVAGEDACAEWRERLDGWIQKTGDFVPGDPPFESSGRGWGPRW